MENGARNGCPFHLRKGSCKIEDQQLTEFGSNNNYKARN